MSIVNQYTPVNSGNVTVPKDFCGMAFIGWPSSGSVSGPVNPPNNLKYRHTVNDAWQINTSSSTLSLSAWNQIETSSGVFNWNNLDTFIAGHAARGATVCFQNIWMPTFYSTNAATLWQNGYYGIGGPLNSAGQGTTFSAGVSGGLYNFVYQTVLRYKNKGTPIKYWQSWVEPILPATLGSGTWWGSAGDLVDLCYWSYLAAKSADPTITVIGPATFDSSGNPSTSVFHNVTGTINTGIHGYQTFDEWGTDSYNVGPMNFSMSIDKASPYYHLKSPYDIQSWVTTLRSGMAGNIKPVSFSNIGISDNVGAGNIAFAAFVQSQTPFWRKQWLARSMLTLAALGVTRACVWNYDYYVWTGGNANFYFLDFVNDTTGVVAGFNEIADNVAGKTITFCGYKGDGSMIANFSDGSSYSI